MALNPKKIIKKKQSGDVTDWLGYAVIISVVLIGGFFILNQIDYFSLEQDFKEAQIKRASDISLYEKNLEDPENTPHKVYEEARQALLNNDLESALDTIHPESRWKYEDNLIAAHEDGNLSQLAEPMKPLKEVISEYGNVRVYGVGETIDKTASNPYDRYDNFIEFMTNNKGIWKISSI